MNNFGIVFASKMLVENKRKVRFMYHEKTSDKQDSGWRFFCGDEDDEYANNPDNIGIYDINTIISIDSDIVPFLKNTGNVAFERKEPSSSFSILKDFLRDKEGN